MANNNRIPSPVLSLPPLEYDVHYMNNIVRLINYFIEQMDNPGHTRGFTATFTQLPTSATDLPSGSVWRDPVTNNLKIVP